MTKKAARNREICRRYANGESMTEIAGAFGISRQRVDQIVRPRRQRVRGRTSRAIASGRLVRPDICERCGAGGDIHAHHPNYDRPTDVEWLCSTCHMREHHAGVERVERVTITCEECGAKFERIPSRVILTCSRRCAARVAGRKHRRRARRRAVEGAWAMARRLKRYAQAVGRVPASGEFAGHVVGDVSTSPSATLVNQFSGRLLGTYSEAIDLVYTMAGFRRPDGRSEPNGYPLSESEAA